MRQLDFSLYPGMSLEVSLTLVALSYFTMFLLLVPGGLGETSTVTL